MRFSLLVMIMSIMTILVMCSEELSRDLTEALDEMSVRPYEIKIMKRLNADLDFNQILELTKSPYDLSAKILIKILEINPTINLKEQIYKGLEMKNIDEYNIVKYLDINPETNFEKENQALAQDISDEELIKVLKLNKNLQIDDLCTALQSGIDINEIIQIMKINPNIDFLKLVKAYKNKMDEYNMKQYLKRDPFVDLEDVVDCLSKGISSYDIRALLETAVEEKTQTVNLKKVLLQFEKGESIKLLKEKIKGHEFVDIFNNHKIEKEPEVSLKESIAVLTYHKNLQYILNKLYNNNEEYLAQLKSKGADMFEVKEIIKTTRCINLEDVLKFHEKRLQNEDWPKIKTLKEIFRLKSNLKPKDLFALLNFEEENGDLCTATIKLNTMLEINANLDINDILNARKNYIDYFDIIQILKKYSNADMETQVIRPLRAGIDSINATKILEINPKTNFLKEIKALQYIEDFYIPKILKINKNVDWEQVIFAKQNGLDEYEISKMLTSNPNIDFRKVNYQDY